jgi:hypothetical protein
LNSVEYAAELILGAPQTRSNSAAQAMNEFDSSALQQRPTVIATSSSCLVLSSDASVNPSVPLNSRKRSKRLKK